MEFIDFAGSYHVVQCLKWLYFCLFDLIPFSISSKRQNKQKSSYHKDYVATENAEICNIRFRGSACKEIGPTLKNFVFTHDKFVDSEVIFRKSEIGNISLMDVTPTHVCFCVTDFDIDVHDILRFKSMGEAQLRHGKKLILIPHRSFQKLLQKKLEAIEDGKSTATIVLLSNVGGENTGEKLCQMMAQIPNTRVLCNPWVFAHAHALFSRTKNEGSNSEYQEILASFMDYLSICDERKMKTVFLKLPIFCMPQGIIINKIFPTINHICIAGYTQSSIESLFKKYNAFDFDLFCNYVYPEFWADYMPLPYESLEEDEAHIEYVRNWLERDRKNNIIRTISVNCTLLYASAITTFLKDRDIYNSVYLEEDFITNDKETFRSFLDSLGLEASIVKDIEMHCKDTYASLIAKTNSPVDSSDEMNEDMGEEEWEEAKDIFFMLRVPFDVESTDESKEKFAKTIMKRPRKRGRYGPLGVFPASRKGSL